MKRIVVSGAVICSLFLILIPGAGASDGVLEINQACVSVGCFSGDDPDWPVEIENPGSYILTSNLTVPDRFTTGIFVRANDVKIDLNNFSMIGPVRCPNGSCNAGVGTGFGVVTDPAGVNLEPLGIPITGTSVKNGSIIGFGRDGVFLNDQAEATNLRTRWNLSDGIRTGVGSTVSGSTAYENGSDGIWVSSGSKVSGNVVYGNSSNGISLEGSMAFDNSVNGNEGYGLHFRSGTNGYGENVIFGNAIGAVFGDGVEFGQNVCNGDTTCP